MSLVELHRISRRFGRVVALSEVSLSLAPGTIGLVGNNGAGKSTLLKILLGLLSPDGGHGTILGCDIRRASLALRGRVGYMPEAHAIVPLLKGVEFVALAGDMYGMPHRDACRRAHEVLNYVGLGELRYRRLDEYSTGNLQRLKLASALVHDPELLLLDEPTNGLDPAGRKSMLRLIQDLIAETQKSVILCTHLLGDVERICSHVVVMHKGSVVQSGPLTELRARGAGQYEIGWIGDGTALLERLRGAGVTVGELIQGQRARVVVRPGWETRDFFVHARSVGAVLSQVTPDEEDLERLFIRVTAAEHSALGQDGGVPLVHSEPHR